MITKLRRLIKPNSGAQVGEVLGDYGLARRVPFLQKDKSLCAGDENHQGN
jgi:hypothetical protein